MQFSISTIIAFVALASTINCTPVRTPAAPPAAGPSTPKPVAGPSTPKPVAGPSTPKPVAGPSTPKPVPGPSTPNPAPGPVGPNYAGCSPDQQAMIKARFQDASTLANSALELLGQPENVWSKNKGYNRYFKNGDADAVRRGFRALVSVGTNNQAFNFQIRCGKAEKGDCGTKTGWAFADPTPEDFAGNGHVKGTKFITICPIFFTDPKTVRRLPAPNDQAAIQEYCKFKETKNIMDFEVGGHTLMHELTHLDTFGIAAGYPQEKFGPVKGDTFTYNYHGTIDWKNKSTAGNAESLKKSTAANKVNTWQNAESFSAAALSIKVMELCNVKDVPN